VSRATSSSSTRKFTRPRFCVVSLNPAIDVEWRVDALRWEEKNLVMHQRRWAGGKGANVARWLNFLGSNCELLIPLGGVAGNEMAEHLRRDCVRTHVIKVSDETRANVVITGADGRQMRFNQPGARLSAMNWRAVVQHVTKAARQGVSLILSGSLAPGLRGESYAEILRAVRNIGVRTFVDCDGETLKHAVRERPFLVKPNRHELAQWIGDALPSLRAVRQAALEMSRATHGWVLVSLSEDGAMLVNTIENFTAHLRAGHVNVMNTLGAGDATLAAAAHAAMSGELPIKWLRAAVAAGTAATQVEAGRLPTKSLLRAVSTKIR
jgi:1-phosphofructokinase